MKSFSVSVKLALVDDHQLVRGGIKLLLEKITGFKVIIEASNGVEVLEKLASAKQLPQIVLIDVSMPLMDGYETTRRINENFPGIKTVALSVHDDLKTVNAMIESGANAYLLKDASPGLVESTVRQVIEKGYYYDQRVIESFLHERSINDTIKNGKFGMDPASELTLRETEFIKYCCTELTYKEIADKMNITPRTVDGYRESVFLKLNLKSRTGIVLFAVNHKIYERVVNKN